MLMSLNSFRYYVGIVAKLAIFGALLVSISYLGEWIIGQFSSQLGPSTEPVMHSLIMMAIGIYIILMMLPFVPGVEIGLGMIAMFGAKIAPLVYGGTVLALTFSFLFGRLVPHRTIIKIFETLRLTRAADLLRQIETLDTNDRLQFLVQNASSHFVPFLLRHRYLAFMLSLNLPGNALIGGGGGICMVIGFSRLFPFSRFFATLVIAVSPIPLFIYYTSF